jgi:hypothetical protein
MCVAILPQALQRADRWHLAYVGCLTIPLSFIALLHLAASWREAGAGVRSGSAASFPLFSGRGRRYLTIGAIGSSTALLAGLIVQQSLLPLWVDLLQVRANDAWVCTTCVANEGRWLPVFADKVKPLQAIIDELELRSAPGDRLFVGPRDLSRTNYNDSFMLFLFPKLKPGNYYIEVASGVANRPGGRTSADLSRSRFALLDSAYDRWREKNSSSIPGSTEPLVVLDREFCLIMERPPYQLYARCDRAAGEPARK